MELISFGSAGSYRDRPTPHHSARYSAPVSNMNLSRLQELVNIATLLLLRGGNRVNNDDEPNAALE